MAQQRQKEHARELREQGRSITEIARVLSASKSTVSYWCRNISLSKAQQLVLAEKQVRAGAVGRLRAAEQKRAQRLASVRDDMSRGSRDIGSLSQRDVFILGIALYWGEGYKNGNEECGLTNSDPAIIMTFISWLRNVYRVRDRDLILRISLNETHRHRMHIVEKYWSRMTNIPLSQFTKTSLIRSHSKKIFANTDQHFGTLRVKVRRGTFLRRRIMGSIEKLKKEFLK